MFGTPAKKSRERLDNGLLIDVPGIPELDLDKVRVAGKATKAAFEDAYDPTVTYTRTGERAYNCIAWSVGDDTHFFSPGTVAEMDGFYAKYGLRPTDEANAEVAMWTLNGAPTHDARRIIGDWYESKLGPGYRIIHQKDQLNGFGIKDYGSVTHYHGR